MPDAAPYVVRQLCRTDLGLTRSLLAMFGAAFEDLETYEASQPSDSYLSDLLGKEHFIVLATLAGDEVVGGLTAYQLDKFEQDRREIYIYDLAVAEAHRRMGVATGLISKLKEIAAERDVYVIFVQADLEDAPAIALYQSLGRQETAHHFDIEVPSPEVRRGRSQIRR
jgi:aminoglycoside 3-N-acetyltransferase I